MNKKTRLKNFLALLDTKMYRRITIVAKQGDPQLFFRAGLYELSIVAKSVEATGYFEVELDYINPLVGGMRQNDIISVAKKHSFIYLQIGNMKVKIKQIPSGELDTTQVDGDPICYLEFVVSDARKAVHADIFPSGSGVTNRIPYVWLLFHNDSVEAVSTDQTRIVYSRFPDCTMYGFSLNDVAGKVLALDPFLFLRSTKLVITMFNNRAYIEYGDGFKQTAIYVKPSEVPPFTKLITDYDYSKYVYALDITSPEIQDCLFRDKDRLYGYWFFKISEEKVIPVFLSNEAYVSFTETGVNDDCIILSSSRLRAHFKACKSLGATLMALPPNPYLPAYSALDQDLLLIMPECYSRK